MIEMDSIVKSNGIIRGLFMDFLASEKFRKISDILCDREIPIGEIVCGENKLIVKDCSQADDATNEDPREMAATEYGKFFRVAIVLPCERPRAISGHRIIHPSWLEIDKVPSKTNYLAASCWVYAEGFFENPRDLEKIVEKVLKSADPDKLYETDFIPEGQYY